MKPTNESPANPSGSKADNKPASPTPGGMEALLNEYAESHRNPVNKRIHYLCVPAIFWSILVLFWGIKLPVPFYNLAVPASLLVFAYYLKKAPTLSIPLAFFMGLALASAYAMEHLGLPVWPIALSVFVIAWAGQFIGHIVEGKKPSFFKDLQFLLVGPAWIARQLLIKKRI